MPSPTQYSVIVPAAGIGKRMKAACPKQYLNILGKPIIEHTLENLLAHPQIKTVVVALNPNDTVFKTLAISKHPNLEIVTGGKERSDSVLAGLNYLPDNEKWVLVHDAARPCLQHSDLSALLNLADTGPHGGILAAPVRDTMKRGVLTANKRQSRVKHTESRDNLWHALTPQFFPLPLLKHALSSALLKGVEITDEASAIEFISETVLLVEGRASNIKVTQPEDLLLAEFYLSQPNN
ncbi:2-C-methyl-D-erythritol 4-phosphate cytidylyltransferase [Paraglaciecola sp. 2405UD69-4]|uniref:2-C-methyl-D-erythritol 4-phosphate cytidylyltransferase n=1 Tax=Paraglaciecola sp. 2405UD69-4 TaxID=3391836 RepID=UPI0039C9E140